MNYTVPFGQLRMSCVELQTVGTSKTTCFGDKGAGVVVLLRKFDDYYNGYQDETGKRHPGYVDLVKELYEKFLVDEIGIQDQL